MGRREEITAERDRLAQLCRDICDGAVKESREATIEEKTAFDEALLVIDAIQTELKSLDNIVVADVRLDARLTQERGCPETPKACLEAIDELKAELEDKDTTPARKAGIQIELETWNRELQHAHARQNRILNQSRTRQPRSSEAPWQRTRNY